MVNITDLTWTLPVKAGSLQVFNQRVGNILGQAGNIPQSHSRHKKGHMTNINLMDSGDEAIVDFVNDHKELYNKTNEHFKD